MPTAKEPFILITNLAWDGTGALNDQMKGKSFYINGYTDKDAKKTDYIAENSTASYSYDGPYVSDYSDWTDKTGPDLIAVSAGKTLPSASGKFAHTLGIKKYSITLSGSDTVLTQADFGNAELPIHIIETTDSNGKKIYPVVIDFLDIQTSKLNGKPQIAKIFIPENNSLKSEHYDYIDPHVYDDPYTPSKPSEPSKPSKPVCFTAGTLIVTDKGEKRVETLRPGDLVLTRDRGVQPLRWAGSSRMSHAALMADPKIRPIRIRASALAPKVPDRDLIVSPQHRILLRSNIVRRMFDTDTVLAAAKHLLGVSGVEIVEDFFDVTYVHVMLKKHEIVRAHGVWSESLYLGKQAQLNLTSEQMEEIGAIFPDLLEGEIPHLPAGMFAKGALTRQLVQRSLKNRQVLFNDVT